MDSAMFYCGSEEYSGFNHQQTTTDHGHFLEACFMCQKPLGLNRDIFMYRGNTAFCSDECRQEQIEMDEARERRKKHSASARELRKAAPSPAGSSAAGSDTRSTVAGAVTVA